MNSIRSNLEIFPQYGDDFFFQRTHKTIFQIHIGIWLFIPMLILIGVQDDDTKLRLLNLIGNFVVKEWFIGEAFFRSNIRL